MVVVVRSDQSFVGRLHELSNVGECQLGGRRKRIFDIVGATGLIVFLAPVMIAVAFAVWIGRPGSTFFGHSRIGFEGRKFKCLKYRSMVADSSEVLRRHFLENPAARAEWAETRKLRDDPRVTRIGKLLRRSSMDELPQLFNVLRGEMSLVGPRPITDEEASRYGSDFSLYKRARPGITGLWQVSGRSDCDYETRVRLDVAYVSNWSLLLDVRILIRTVGVVLRQEGSR
ncbi:UDP-phosphate galactose phosphotransferase [Sinorhizobium fredii]|uniref:UDP-phosphate galactose phosphotransferase n=2 Tax=Rhizobium fredii TaxID=380 RepID=A0A2A6M7Z4_RHIFR|nr:UDP-phosphate galactose phosphotransferase [Sinorhizobium fredii]